MQLAILANREGIIADVKHRFPEEPVVVAQVVPDMSDYLKVAKSFAQAIEEKTSLGDDIVLVLAAPVVVAYMLGVMFAHSSRRIQMGAFNLQTKQYELIDVSNHLTLHLQ